jgi:hypothetical protein
VAVILWLLGCGLRDLAPGPPVLSPAERAAFDAPVPARVTYTSEPRVAFPVLPVQVWGLRYALDIVLVSEHPDWVMHEYARVDLPDGPLWLAKDAGVDYEQTIVASVPDIRTWVPEVPVRRVEGPLDVVDAGDADTIDLTFRYTNPKGQPVEVHYGGPMPTKPSSPRNGNTMGHSAKTVAALLDLHLFRPGGDAEITIGGEPTGVKRLWGLYPMKFALAQTQGGLAVASYRQEPADGGFRLVRPAAGEWPTEADERWIVDGDTASREGPVTLRYRWRDGELVRAQAWQAGVDVPVTDVVFSPALPDVRRAWEGVVESRFAVDIAGQPGHGVGTVKAWWEGDTVIVETVPEAPHWFASRPMRGVISWEEGATVRIGRI